MTLTNFTGYAPTITLNREKRTITGKIVEFGTPTSDYRRLVVHEGALKPREPLKRVKMLRDHDDSDPVGFMLSMLGDVATFKIPEGENGDRALTEAENGLRDGLSVGFQVSDEPESFMYDEADGSAHVYKAELLEVSLVAIPAFAGAGVTSVAASINRQKEGTEMPNPTPVTPVTTEQLTAALDRFADDNDRNLEARFASLAAPTPTAPKFSNFGALVRAAVIDKDETAIQFAQNLAFAGGTTDDAHQPNTWINDTIRLVDKNRKVLNSFTREPLPADGMTLEYLQLTTNTVSVTKQTAEGEDLPFGKITLDSATASVDTYGGYTEISRQTIERASAIYTNTAFRAMDLEYARATEASARALLTATVAAQETAGNKIVLPATPGVDEWLDLIIDAAETYEDRGYDLEAAKVSKDVFKMLARLEDSAGHRLMLVTGEGVNQVGSLDLSSISGKVGPVRFELFPGADPLTGTFYDPIALTSWESPGAPWMVDQENNINLTKSFSKYGYAAFAAQFPDALLPIEFTV